MLRRHRHAEHRQAGLGSQHAGQMRRATGCADQYLDTTLFGAGRIVNRRIRRTMRLEYFRLIGNRKILQRHGGGTQHRPIAVGAHDDADEW